MDIKFHFPDNDLNSELKNNSMKYFDFCPKCSVNQNDVEDWIKHLIDRHPYPIEWMSDTAKDLIGDNVMKPYTAVTESRKKRKKNITPRPLNSFMIFSRHFRRSILIFFTDASNSEISKLLGKLWNNISAPIKSMYDSEAKKLALLHSKEFPDYKYQPKKKDKPYVMRRSLTNCAPLSNNSSENANDNISFSISNVIRQSSNHLPRKTTPVSVTAYEHSPENVSTSVVDLKSKSIHLMEDKINKKSTKNCKKQNISNQMFEDSEDAASSPMSFKNTMNSSVTSKCSPVILNDSRTTLSDLNFILPFSNLIKQTNNNNIDSCSPLYSLKMDDKGNQESTINYKLNVNDNANLKLSTTPLTIVTSTSTTTADKVDFQPSKVNMRFVKMINNKPMVHIYNKEMITKGCKKILISQSSISDNFDKKNRNGNSNLPVLNLNPTVVGNGSVVGSNVSNFINCNDDGSFNDMMNLEFNYKPMNLDPLINENMFEGDSFEDNVNALNFDTTDNVNSSSWSFKSPNFKLCAELSSGSEIAYKEAFGGSSSPFHLSENENNSAQTAAIQRLPAIGSWLRSNYSEFMI